MKNILIIIACIASVFATKAQSITTIAGSGTADYTGDGGQATLAALQNPIAVYTDATGNIFICDCLNNVVRKVNTSGVIMTVAGNGTPGYNGDNIQATAAELYQPIAVCEDGSGDLLIADGYNNRIRMVTPSGLITTIAGNGTAGYTGDGSQATAAELKVASGVTIDASGNIYCADQFNYAVRKISTSGIITTYAGTGIKGYNGDGIQSTVAELSRPYGIFMDQSGNLFIPDLDNNRLRKVSPSGIITTIAGTGTAGFSGDGGQATNAQIRDPSSVALDAAGNIYFTDEVNARVRFINTAGVISTIAGDGIQAYGGDGDAATAAELNYPHGVWINASGDLLIADYSNNRVRKVTSSIDINPLVITPSSPTICSGSSITLVASGGTTYTWSTGQTGDSLTVSPASSTTYTVSSIVNGVTQIQTINVAVNPPPTINISPSSAAVCPGSSTLLTASGASTYVWNDGETASSITVSPSSTTTYSVIGTNALGCKDSASQVIVLGTTSCTNSIVLPAGYVTADYSFQSCDSTVWFSFTADSAGMIFEVTQPVLATDTPFAYIHSLVLYSGPCGSDSLVAVTVHNSVNPNDSLPGIQVFNLVPGTTYHVKVTRYSSGVPLKLAYFGIRKVYLPHSIIPSCTASACDATSNLFCNGDFENTPGWLATPTYGFNGPLGYMDNSFVYPATPLVAGNPPFGYCIQSPNMRYAGGLGGVGGCSGNSYTDVYMITKSIGGGFNNTAESGSYFMAIDCPSNVCSECTVPGACAPTINTTIGASNYVCHPWQETVPVIPLTPYVFNAWVRQMDNGFAATVNMYVNTTAGTTKFFSDAITAAAYGNWVNVCYSYTPPAGVTSATFLIEGIGAAGPSGYDFELDNLSLQYTSIPSIAASASPASICSGTSTTLSVTPVIPGAVIQWSNGAASSSISVSPTTTTVYTVTETVGTCQSIATCTVTVMPSPVVTITATNPCGSGNGIATASVTGGVGPYNYVWSNGIASQAVILPPGTYTVTVTGSNGCSSTASVTIVTLPVPSVTITSTNICGTGTGSATATATGGSTPYTYSWSDGKTTSTVTGLKAGTYTVTVTGANGCSASTSVTILSNPLPPDMAGSNQTTCAGTCVSIGTNITGVTPYTFTWAATSGIVCAHCAYPTVCPTVTTVYTETVADPLTGCSSVNTVTVTVKPSPVIAITATDPCGSGTGTATAHATGGTLPYTYSWSSGQTTSSVSGLIPGTYTVTVTGKNGCSTSAAVTIISLPAPSVTATTTSVCGTAGTGTATATVTGGVSPYTYSWSDGKTTSTITGLTSGNYTVTVTGANGCKGAAVATVTSNPLPPDFAGANQTTCSGTCVSIGNSTVGAPYTFTWAATSGIICAHCAYPTVCPTVTTVYTETVTNTNTGCSSVSKVTVTVKPSPVITMAVTDACGSGAGTATAHVSGGTAPYKYSWSSGQTTSSVTGLIPGGYTVTVTGSNGCSTSATITITSLPAPIVTISSNVPCAGTTATVTAIVTGGVSPYTYSWSDGKTTSTITGVPFGVYTVTVTGANGCKGTATIAIRPNPLPNNLAGPNQSVCSGSCVNIGTNLGPNPYSFSWAPATNLSCTTCDYPSACPSATTVYAETVTDIHTGCSSTYSVTLTVKPSPVITTTATSGCASTTGNATAKVTGGAAPYTYSWSDGQTTSTITGVPLGTYTVIVTGKNGCSSSATVTINSTPLPPNFAGPNQTICEGACANIGTNPGSGSYYYSWSAGGSLSCLSCSYPSACPTVTTVYSETVTDATTGCQSVSTVTVTVNPLPPVPVISGPSDACGSPASASPPYTVTNVTSGDTYSWTDVGGSPASGTGTSAGVTFTSAGGTITFTATNADGCSSSATFTVNACCIPTTLPPGSIVVNNQTASSIGNGLFFTNASYIYINGTFTVDENMAFSSCLVSMGPNAKIVVLPGVSLALGNQSCCHIFAGCGQMWDGIYVEPGGDVYTGGNGVIVEDAINGIVVENSGTTQGIFYLNAEMIFNKCHISLQIQPLASGTVSGYTYGTTFTCRDLSSIAENGYNCPNTQYSGSWIESFPLATLLPPYAGQRSAIGIEVQSVNQINLNGIGNLSLQGNLFDNLDEGIVSTNSNILVQNQIFQHINSASTSDGAIVANGAIVAGPTYALTIGGGPVTTPSGVTLSAGNLFTDCTNGVLAQYGFNNILISNNTFNFLIPATNSPSNTAAITIEKTGLFGTDNAVVTNNTINNAYVGIACGLNSNINCDINNNTINGGNFCSSSPNIYGIGLNEGSLSSTAFYNVHGNTISDLHYGIIGVYLEDGSYISQNSITLTQGISGACTGTIYGEGIAMQGSQNCKITDNNITVATYSSAAQSETGIYLASSPSTIVCNNNITGFADGIGFYSTGPATVSSNNIYSNGFANAIGMYITGTGLGNQGSNSQPYNNTWNGVFSCSTSDATATKFFVQGAHSSGNTYDPSGYATCTGPTVTYSITGSAPACSAPPPIVERNGSESGTTAINNSSNASLNGTDHFGQTVNDIYVASLETKMGYLNTDQLNILRSIAVKCPFEDGVSVYLARSILARYDGLLKYSNACENNIESNYIGIPNQVQDVNEPALVNIYPNPNNGTFTLEYKLTAGQSGKVTIFNTMGSMVGTYELNDSEGKIMITGTNLANGIYIYKLSVNDQIEKVGKITIIK